jgi:hypothetical protein
MANPVPQNYGNHTRWDPAFHFFALPVILLTVIAGLSIACSAPAGFRAGSSFFRLRL